MSKQALVIALATIGVVTAIVFAAGSGPAAPASAGLVATPTSTSTATPTVTPTPTSIRPPPAATIDKTANGQQGPIDVVAGSAVMFGWVVYNAGDRPFNATVDDDTHDALDGSCSSVGAPSGTCSQSAVVVLLTPGPITDTATVHATCILPCTGDTYHSDSVTVNVVTPTPGPPKLPYPGDSDGDGCSDAQENGPDVQLGGRRYYLNPYDFYDVDGNKVINVFGDIIPVAQAFGPDTGPNYTPAKDRSAPPPPGLNPLDPSNNEPWDMGPPDHAITIFADIIGVAMQFGHNCA